MAVRRAASLLLLWHASAADDKVCEAGTGKCSEGLSADGETGSLNRLSSIMANSKDTISSYSQRFQDNGTLEERKTTDEYYDLATDFYEYGWGSSFHFASRFKGETLAESITRHEYFLAAKLGIGKGSKVADLGMGVGGPLRSIARFSGADITGVTINNFQVQRANTITKKQESEQAAKRMHYVHGDFTNLVPKVFEPESLDAVYYIESACHLSNRTEIFVEAARALKKGGRLFNYEWVLTDRYDEKNPEHMEIKRLVEYGNGIEQLIHYKEVQTSLEKAGFKIIEMVDLADEAEQMYGDNNVPWYYDMAQEFAFSSISAFKLSQFGQRTLQKVLWLVEKIGLVPAGAIETEDMLSSGGRALVKGGQTKVFTPMYYFLAEKN